MPENLQAELDALKSAYRSGTRRVTYEGKTVEYDDEAGLRRRIAFIEAEMATASGQTRPVARFARFSRAR
jgi:3-phenylpropionate/cinnamic acid dioxygenase small subunit